METTILKYADGDTVFSSEFDTIRATTAWPLVPVTVSCQTDVLFTNVLYAYEGEVSLIDPGRLAEEYLRQKGLHTAFFTFGIGDAQIQLQVRYCEYKLPPASINTDDILSVLRSQRTHLDSYISLSAYRRHTTFHVTAQGVGHDATGRMTSTAVQSLGPVDASGTMSWPVKDIVTLLLAAGGSEIDCPPVDICFFTLNYNGGSKTFYIVNDDCDYLTFRFRNIFNAFETVDIPGIVQNNTEIERHFAVCGGVATLYDQTASRTYVVQSAALPIEEARMIDQLFNSREVQLMPRDPEDAPREVLITEHTCEIDNSNEALATVKFTFRFPSDRVYLFGDEIDVFRAKDKVFAQEFTNPFS